MEERLVVITLKAVRNDDKQSEIKEEIKTSPLKAVPKLARSAVHSCVGSSNMVQLFLTPLFLFNSRDDGCRRSKPVLGTQGPGQVTISSFLGCPRVWQSWGTAVNIEYQSEALPWGFWSKTTGSSAQDSAFSTRPLHRDGDSESHSKTPANSFCQAGKWLPQIMYCSGPYCFFRKKSPSVWSLNSARPAKHMPIFMSIPRQLLSSQERFVRMTDWCCFFKEASPKCASSGSLTFL